MIDLSSVKQRLGDRKLAIVGLGISGFAAFEACRAAGIETVLWDDDAAKKQQAIAMGGTVRDITSDVLKDCALVCLAPSIPLTHPKPHPVVILARHENIPVICDIELFHMAKPDARVIGITGTNGKSTTTTLIGHILTSAGMENAVGGNIGKATLSLPELGPDGIYVIELSSYQIDLLRDFRPTIAVHLNFSPDHLDRHGDMAGYVAVKEKLFEGEGLAVIGIDDAESHAMFERVRQRKTRRTVPVSCQRPLMSGVFASSEGMMFDGAQRIFNLETCPALKGLHNWQNAAAAYAACREINVPMQDIIRALQNFPGLKHRQHLITTVNGVAYVNDSKATNDDAAAVALKTYNPIYWIAGGKSKGAGYVACEQSLDHVRHAFLIGAAEAEMADWLTENKIPFTRWGTLDKAVAAARKKAEAEHRPRATVLLSPACSSFDQFSSFEERGDVFTDLVLAFADKKGVNA